MIDMTRDELIEYIQSKKDHKPHCPYCGRGRLVAMDDERDMFTCAVCDSVVPIEHIVDSLLEE